jgi:hypothetical protein
MFSDMMHPIGLDWHDEGVNIKFIVLFSCTYPISIMKNERHDFPSPVQLQSKE